MSSSATNHVTGLENGFDSGWWTHTVPEGSGNGSSSSTSWGGPWDDSYDTTVSYPGFWQGRYYGRGYGGGSGEEDYIAYVGDAFSDASGPSTGGMFPFAYSGEELLLGQAQGGNLVPSATALEQSTARVGGDSRSSGCAPSDGEHRPIRLPATQGRAGIEQTSEPGNRGSAPLYYSPGGAGFPGPYFPVWLPSPEELFIEEALRADKTSDMGRLLSMVPTLEEKRMLARLVYEVRQVVLVPGGANRCHRWTESARDRIVALEKRYYQNERYTIEYIEWRFPPRGGWTEHGGLLIKFADGRVAYLDNGVIGGDDRIGFPENVPRHWTVQNTQDITIPKGRPAYVSWEDLKALPRALWNLGSDSIRRLLH